MKFIGVLKTTGESNTSFHLEFSEAYFILPGVEDEKHDKSSQPPLREDKYSG